jgi:hypothetical protein
VDLTIRQQSAIDPSSPAAIHSSNSKFIHRVITCYSLISHLSYSSSLLREIVVSIGVRKAASLRLIYSKFIQLTQGEVSDDYKSHLIPRFSVQCTLLLYLKPLDTMNMNKTVNATGGK